MVNTLEIIGKTEVLSRKIKTIKEDPHWEIQNWKIWLPEITKEIAWAQPLKRHYRRVWKLEDNRAAEIIYTEENRGKNIVKNEYILRNLWDSIELSKFHIIGIL